jgi:hypothetical protein
MLLSALTDFKSLLTFFFQYPINHKPRNKPRNLHKRYSNLLSCHFPNLFLF